MTTTITLDPHRRCPPRLRYVWAITAADGTRLDYGRASTQTDAEGQANRALTRLRGRA